jgi:hypothetical protein
MLIIARQPKIMKHSLSLVTALLTMNVAVGFSPAIMSQQRVETKLLSTSIGNDAGNSSRRNVLVTTAAATAAMLMIPPPALARLEPVNRPDLLPSESGLNVIQTEKFFTPGQARRMNDMLKALERDTGFRVRVLCQNYPNTPGLAIRDYWDLGKEGQKDDKYVVLVVDQFGGRGNVLNFNVGDGLKFALPNIFWTRLSGKYGTVSERMLLGLVGCCCVVVVLH